VLHFPNDTWIMFVGLAFLGCGFAGVFAPAIPTVIEVMLSDLNSFMIQEGTEVTEDKIKGQITDKASALVGMSFAFGSVLSPILGGAI
jgi:MFS family permease